MTTESYGQYCPITRAVEAIGQRWSILILRDLTTGTTRFNDLARGLPGISRTLLSTRLKQLEESGLVEKAGGEYHLSDAGRDLEDVLMGLGAWGAKWLLDDPREDELDSEFLVWRVHLRLDTSLLPPQRFVLHLRFSDDPKQFWIVIDDGVPSVCTADHGFDVDVSMETDMVTLLRVWLGREPLRPAIAEDRIRLTGRREAIDLVPDLLLLSEAAEFPALQR